MKTVIINPERCVGCMQCRFQCALAHSKSKDYFSVFEEIPSKPRIHIVKTKDKEPFPNKCRHCNPAPCEQSCITKAIYRANNDEIVLINPDKCINCGMCAMACPFGVIRYHLYPHRKLSAHKCDQCILRLTEGEKPACVSACKVSALVYDDINKYMTNVEGRKIAELVYLGIREKREENINGYNLLKAYNKSLLEISRR
ncbi:MAG: 4Fe-4S binding protein [Proteobacteria bacterium]|nr:4Fe-4S binding protein [Pseudomonadota bacterium]